MCVKRELIKPGKGFEQKIKSVIGMKTKLQHIQIKIEMSSSIVEHIEDGNDES